MTTFYGLYFTHHYTYYKLQSFHMLELCRQLSCTASTPVFGFCSRVLACSMVYHYPLTALNLDSTHFHSISNLINYLIPLKNSRSPGFELGTSLVPSRLSYPGLDKQSQVCAKSQEGKHHCLNGPYTGSNSEVRQTNKQAMISLQGMADNCLVLK